MKRKEQLDQLGQMTQDELNDQADALKESLFRLKFRKTLGVGEVVKDIRREKKTLARVYTLLNSKKEAEAETAEAKA
jgi:ribosomal protein L29